MSHEHSTTPRALGYARCSTLAQEESVADQCAWIERACRVERLELARTFADEGAAGDEMNRPGLLAMLALGDAEFFADRQFSALVVWDLDRLSRGNQLFTSSILNRLVPA